MFKSLLLIGLIPATALSAQDEPTLRKYFEGKTVIVKIDMPATSDGIDVYPDRSTPLEFPKLATRIKESGVGVRQGESIMIMKVHVKGGLIELQLGGGGYGTFSDALTEASSAPQTPLEFPSKREKDLEILIKTETNATRKRETQKELDDLRRERNRANALATAMNAQTKQAQRANARESREHSGSRFNVRYPDGMTAAALTPAGMMAALNRYVTFPAEDFPTSTETPAPAAVSSGAGAAGAPVIGIRALKKGLLLADVEKLLGPASTASKETKGGLEVSTREYVLEGQRVTASFVGGVLVDYSIKPAG